MNIEKRRDKMARMMVEEGSMVEVPPETAEAELC